MSTVQVEGLVKDFDDATHVLKGIDLTVRDGSFTILLGPSGCGKSTLLRIVAGLERPTAGRVLIDGVDVTDAEPSERQVAMVFQNYALYPHMSAFENVEYGLKVKRVPKAERREMVEHALELVDLADQAKKRPSGMSGGQRQRVALARAIVKRPGVYLMDEPLSNLDAKLRGQMRESISRLHDELGSTFLYVTHDQVEAMSMGTDIVLLHEGSIAQEGTPREIYQEPASTYAAGFIGAPPANVLGIEDGFIAVRPEYIALTEPEVPAVALPATLTAREQLGDSTIHSFATPLGDVRAKTPCLWDAERAANTRIFLPLSALMCFDAQGKRVAPPENLERLIRARVAA